MWASGAVLGAQALMAVYAVLTARLLGPDGKGIVTSISTWNQLLAWGSVAGISTALSVGVAGAREAEAGEDVVRNALANATVITLVLGGVLVGVASLFLPSALAHLGSSARSLTVLSLVTIPIQMLATLTLMIQIGLGHTKTYAWAQLAAPVTLMAMTAGFWLVTSDLRPLHVVVSGIVSASVSLCFSARALPWTSMRLKVASLRRDVVFGAKLHLGSLLRLTNLRLDYLVMSTALSAIEVGLYSAANSAMIPIATVPVVAATLLGPMVATLQNADDEAGSRATQLALIRHKAKKFTLASLLGAVAICVLSPVLVTLVLGRDFRGSVQLIWILAPGYVALCYNNIVAAGTAGMKRPWVGTVAELMAVAVTLTLLPFCLHAYGAKGAAAVSTAAYCVSAVVAAIGLTQLEGMQEANPARRFGFLSRLPGGEP
jgi:O-antigen/teichoic acid export membrane protein